MRVLHTSDWHLGKRLFRLDRAPEHKQFLDWLLSTLIDRDIDLLLIAGDIFDSPSPPHHSLDLFYNFLHRVSTETKTETLIIAGNHDSGLLLEAPRNLLSPHRVKVWGKLSSDPEDHWLRITKGKEDLDICAIPFFRSHELLPQGDGDALAALGNYLKRKKEVPQLLMLHHLAGMYEAAGSEQVISLSGVDSIPTALLKHFDYVALGHIHKPQRLGPQTYYSGSPIPLRFSETQPKSVVLIEQDSEKFTIETLPIPLARALITVKANEDQWKEKVETLESASPLTPMVEMQLRLSAPRIGLIDEIKEALTAKGMELLSFLPSYQTESGPERKSSKIFELTTMELFQEFYSSKYPSAPEMPEELKNDFALLLEKVKNATPASQD